MEILLPLVLVLIALTAPRYGSDSRWPASGEPPTPRRRSTLRADAAALVRILGPAHRRPAA
jgi:hypothetical protein